MGSYKVIERLKLWRSVFKRVHHQASFGCWTEVEAEMYKYKTLSGYKSGHGFYFSKIVVAMNVPEFLYKYMFINDKVLKIDPSFYEKIFTENQLYFPKVSELNDPFDCLPAMLFNNCNDEDLKRAFIGRVNIREGRRLSISQLDRVLSSKQMTIKDLFKYNYEHHVVDGFIEDRVFSCSEDPKNILMWTHYANNHKGFCLEFDLRDPKLQSTFLKVDYSHKRPQFTPLDFLKENFDTKFFVSTKDHVWKHECEWRIFGHQIKDTRIVFPPNSITGVILGKRIEKEDEDNIKSWVSKSKKNIAIKRVEFNKDDYGVRIRSN